MAWGDLSLTARAELLSDPPEAQEDSRKPGTAAAEALDTSSKELGSVGDDWD